MSSLRNLMQAISNLNPTAQVSAESIDDITWHVGDPTSKSDIEAEVIRLESEWNAQEYARNRASAFPSIGDQLDMQFHDLVDGTTTWKDAVAKVKADNPKPDGWKE